MHDALEEVCDRLLRRRGARLGGTPATVIVTVTAEQLLTGQGSGTTSDGTRLSVDQILELADQAEVWPAWLTPGGAVLDLGRTRRIATPTQTVALIARDAAAASPAARIPRNGANGTTSSNGCTAAAPTWTISRCCAATTTTTTWPAAGPAE